MMMYEPEDEGDENAALETVEDIVDAYIYWLEQQQ